MAIRSNFPSIKPTLLLDFANTKALDPRITFTRATTATYYDGVTTAKAEENLLLRSQEFDDATWAKLGGSATANTSVAPDGTTTAETLTADGTNGIHAFRQNQAASSVGKTVSVYAKAGTGTLMQILFDADAAPFANFDLSGGTVGTVGSGVTASIVNVGNGWYRCVCTTTSITATNVYFALSNSSSASRYPSYTSSDTLLLWGAQAENRSSVTAYTATTTQAITNYIPVLQTAASGVPRFDHNPITDESLGLLIEEQRTNLFTYSDQFDNAAWVSSNASITANNAIAPDGTLTADKLIANSTLGGHFTGQSVTTTAVAHTFSVYLKAAGYNWAVLYFSGPNVGIFFNLSNGTTGSTFVGAPTSSSITAVGNGWYRCSITATLSTSATPRIYTASADATASFAGDNFSGLFAWGAQLEAGAFATSYIPTVAASVTRNADAASMTGTNFSSWYNAGEGALYGEIGSLASTTATQVPLVSVGDSNNRIEIRGVGNSFTHSRAVVTTSGTTQADMSITTLASSASRKVGVVYKVNDFANFGNGSVGQTDNSGTIPVVSQIQIGTAPYDSNLKLNGTVKKVAYYPIRVTNAEMQGLTTV
jgi:hypothetical protein